MMRELQADIKGITEQKREDGEQKWEEYQGYRHRGHTPEQVGSVTRRFDAWWDAQGKPRPT
jgi:hypothetical protein